MNILITEQQFKLILEVQTRNFKPAVIFDEKYGTNVAQHYKFPGGYDEDEVWDIIMTWFWFHTNEYQDELAQMCDDLDENYFPYPNVKSLDQNTKFQIIKGMASCFNVDDIVWFSVNGIKGFMNTEVHEEQKKLGIFSQVQWVMSPKTLFKVKSQLT
jgi:hypothetical protein